jgi:hypothetical protein
LDVLAGKAATDGDAAAEETSLQRCVIIARIQLMINGIVQMLLMESTSNALDF